MLTWLDWFCLQTLLDVDERQHKGDPRRALALHLGDQIDAFHRGKWKPENILDEVFTALLVHFVTDFMPDGVKITDQGRPIERPLGLLLTRDTVNLLADAQPLETPDELWRNALGPDRTVYIDIPHGAMLMDAGGGTGDIVQIRAIIAAPNFPRDTPGATTFIAQVTERGSERGRGRLAGVIQPNGLISRIGSSTMETATDWTMKPPYAHSLLEKAVLGRAGTFLRLVLAYHFFGPKEARETVAVTASNRLHAGKPRKGESLFALTRLKPSEQVRRPRATLGTSYSLTSRQEVKGYFKMQAHGPNSSLRRLIWVDAYQRGPEDAPLRPQAFTV